MLKRYTRWLHTQWPAGLVEKLPEVREDGGTNIRGLYIVGDLTGIPLLKLSLDTGTKAVRAIATDSSLDRGGASLDLLIIGAGVSGMAAALEAEEQQLQYRVYEAKRRFQTIADFPKRKPIYTYPKEMRPEGRLQVHAKIKEELLEELNQQTAAIEIEEQAVQSVQRSGGLLIATLASGETVSAKRVIVAIGRSGRYRKLDVDGEESDKVYNRLHDPKDYASKKTLVIGGGDSALETAIALADAGSEVTLSYRRDSLSRPKPDNVAAIERLQADPEKRLELKLSTEVARIDETSVELTNGEQIPNDAVFAMLGREAPLDFFRRAGVRIRGETRGLQWVGIALFFLAALLVYDWKSDSIMSEALTGFESNFSFPGDLPQRLAALGDSWQRHVEDRSTLIGTIAVSMKGRSFYYTLGYTLAMGLFGLARIRRRRTLYVTVQTTTLFVVQLIPLFLLPELILPWMGYNGYFDSGILASIANSLFESYIPMEQYLAADWPQWGHPRAYWRAYGFVLAWPLSVYNVFTSAPIVGWLVISFVQTFVLIPLIVWRWGKGAFCGWICSCGGLAETVGDTLRDRMPHGEKWNRLNMVGQLLLAVAFILLAMRIGGWVWPESWMNQQFALVFEGKNAAGETVNPLAWKWVVDVMLAGVIGVGLYVKYSGRVWCRFACPLAALMHIYSRFGQFRIFSDKKKCISCNVCTSVCHQGIDVMNFANKGLPMNDPQCVRCSACVQSCPTGVLTFGRADRQGKLLAIDSLPASNVQLREQDPA
jgi:thioredoxin reductase/ferredoxin